MFVVVSVWFFFLVIFRYTDMRESEEMRFKDISDAAIRQMEGELDQLKAQGRSELKDPRIRPVGLLHIPLPMHVSLPYAEMGQLPQDAARAAKIETTDYFNFNGGIYAFRKLSSLADLFGLPYWHGSEVDLGIIEASFVPKSAAVEMAILPADIFGRLIREHDLLREPLQIRAARVRVPDGPGLSIELDTDALAHYVVGHWSSSL